jgi:uncharacterized protein YcbK (DUF882 family)
MLADGRHFTVAELACHDEARTPYPDAFADRLPELMALLDDVRDTWGGPIEVVSGYRTPAHNAELLALDEKNGAHGVASSSQHVEGRAADIRPAGAPGQAAQLHQAVMRLYNDGKLPQLGGIGLYVKSGWVHVDTYHPPDGHLRRWLGV